MHTFFMMIVALVAAAPAATWESSYSQGQQQAIAQRKPLVVVFAPGNSGLTKVIRAETPAPAIDKLLAEHYVCVHVDTDTAHGRKLAHGFEIQNGVGMVISDREASSQAFWHQGDMPNDWMVHYLAKYADPNVVINTTETAYPQQQRINYYPPPPPAMRPANC